MYSPGQVAQLEYHPVQQKAVGLIPGQGMYLGCGFDAWSRH